MLLTSLKIMKIIIYKHILSGNTIPPSTSYINEPHSKLYLKLYVSDEVIPAMVKGVLKKLGKRQAVEIIYPI